MLFNSLTFFIFFPLVTLLYFLLPHKFRWVLLLAASCFFYMYFIPVYIFVLFFLIIIDYTAGIYLEKIQDKTKKKRLLAMSIIANVGVLAVFKYFNFFNDNLTGFTHLFGQQNPIPYLNIILPIGLSFHTFQAMSYTIEVYRGNYKAEKNLGIYALYVLFYPQLVAGPIERPQNLIPQFYEKHQFEYGRVAAGLKMMLWGFFKKLVIADRLSVFVDYYFNSPSEQNGFMLLLTAYFFSFQLYCDVSGYSDIAIGAAKVMGFRLMENFRVPFLAKSANEFWARWHISLTSWFRDYLYFPLGGNRTGKWRWFFNLFFVFLIVGFWHGANWTYIVWGGLQGLYLIASVMLTRVFEKLNLFSNKNKIITLLKILLTFHIVMPILGIIFRASNIHDAWHIYQNIFSMYKIDRLQDIMDPLYSLEKMKMRIFFTTLLLLIFIVFDKFMDDLVKQRKSIKSKGLSYLLFGLIFISIILFGYFGEIHFIYFQF